MTTEDIKKGIYKYDKLAEKNYLAYQESGEPRYLNSSEKYEDLADVFRMAYRYKDDEDEARTRRMRNVTSFIENHIIDVPKETYTKKEVVDLAKKLKDFVI